MSTMTISLLVITVMWTLSYFLTNVVLILSSYDQISNPIKWWMWVFIWIGVYTLGMIECRITKNISKES